MPYEHVQKNGGISQGLVDFSFRERNSLIEGVL